ncbi:MAG: MBL fold metallo-hydrolase [Reyranella sp.]
MTLELEFHGGAGTVTGSKTLLRHRGRAVLVDCGLFQGLKRLRERNWKPLPFNASELAAVVLTHAHLDHSGALPLLVRSGFRGPIYCTPATQALLAILLRDSARLQEEEAQYANRHGYSKHTPALPLYTEADADRALQQVQPVPWSIAVTLGPSLTATLSPAGHLLGAASVSIDSPEGRVLFSGDLGRPDDLLMRPPAAATAADWVVIESTYGDRRHPLIDAEQELTRALQRGLAREGVIVIPAFAVGRAQSMLLLLSRVKARGLIPDVPVYLDSPMATDVTRIYHAHRTEHRLSPEECRSMCTAAVYVNSVEESKRIDARQGPMIIVSASGMATGGRVVHHLKAFAPDARNMILFGGFQAAGTRGASLVGGAESIKIHGEWIPVRAEVVQLKSASGHADAGQLVSWLAAQPVRPRRVFVNHGEPVAAEALRQDLRRAGFADVSVPELGETITLGGA